jgi:hypothetical protein
MYGFSTCARPVWPRTQTGDRERDDKLRKWLVDVSKCVWVGVEGNSWVTVRLYCDDLTGGAGSTEALAQHGGKELTSAPASAQAIHYSAREGRLIMVPCRAKKGREFWAIPQNVKMESEQNPKTGICCLNLLGSPDPGRRQAVCARLPRCSKHHTAVLSGPFLASTLFPPGFHCLTARWHRAASWSISLPRRSQLKRIMDVPRSCVPTFCTQPFPHAAERINGDCRPGSRWQASRTHPTSLLRGQDSGNGPALTADLGARRATTPILRLC